MRAARYPQITDSRQIRWVSLSDEAIFPIYYWLLFLFSYPLFALHLYYISIYILYIDNRYRVAHPQSSATVQAPFSSLPNLPNALRMRRCTIPSRKLWLQNLQCARAHCISIITMLHRYSNCNWITNRCIIREHAKDGHDNSTSPIHDALMRAFTRKYNSRQKSHIHLHVYYNTRVSVYAVKFTLHVGFLHVPKCFAVCCSPC